MGSKWKRIAVVASLAAFVALFAAACGSGGDDTGTSAGVTSGGEAGGGETEKFVAEPHTGVPGALLPEERKLWKYNDQSGKYEVVAGDASTPFAAKVKNFPAGTKIAYIDPWSADPFATTIREEFESLADKYGFEVIYCDTEFKPEKAIECAEHVAGQGPDFVVAGNWQAGAAAAMMKVLDQAHIPANSIDVAQPNAVFVGADNYTAGQIGGKAAGEFAEREWNCEDVWLLLGEALSEGEAADLRLQGFADGVQEVCGPLPGDQITRERMDSSPEQALTATTDWATAHPQAEHVLAVTLGADRSIGVAKAFQRSQGDGYAVGMTCDAGEQEVIKQAPPAENRFLGCVAFFPERYAPLLIATAQGVLEGKAVPNEVHVEHKFLDHENIDQYYPN